MFHQTKYTQGLHQLHTSRGSPTGYHATRELTNRICITRTPRRNAAGFPIETNLFDIGDAQMPVIFTGLLTQCHHRQDTKQWLIFWCSNQKNQFQFTAFCSNKIRASGYHATAALTNRICITRTPTRNSCNWVPHRNKPL